MVCEDVLSFQFAGTVAKVLPPGGQWKEDVRVLVDCSDSRCSHCSLPANESSDFYCADLLLLNARRIQASFSNRIS